MDNIPHAESRSVRRQRLVAMGASYAMGTFNDNFFKQAGLLLAAAAALFNVQGMATLLFALPFVAFSAWTGWLADRLPKKRIVVWSKAMEIVAMGLGVWAMYTLAWPGIVLVVFLMGLQSTFFSPAINGAIPENFDAAEVPRVNALLKLATTLTILLGIAMAGPFLDLPDPGFLKPYLPSGDNAFGRLALGVFAVTVSIIGFIAALLIKSRPHPARSDAPFPWRGPLDSARHALACRRADRPLFLALASEAFFYFFSSFVVLCITNLGKAQFGLSMTLTSLLNVALMAGVCAGSLLAGRWAVRHWSRHLVGAGLGMGLCLLASSFSPCFAAGARLPLIFLLFAATGFFGGIYLIPVISFIQVRPAAYEKGKILGVSNFACFTGIMISGPLFGFLLEPEITISLAGRSVHWQFEWLRGLTPAMLMGGAGLITLLFMLCLRLALRRAGTAPQTLGGTALGPLGHFLRGLLMLRYRIRARGLDEIEFQPGGKPIIFLPNHPALIDPLVIYSLLPGVRPRPLADETRMSGLWGKAADLYLNAVKIPDLSKISGAEASRLVRQGLDNLAETLAKGHSILLYPAGRIYRTGRESLGGNSGLARILASQPEARLVLVRTTGLWGSSFSYAGARGNPSFTLSLLKGLRDLAANLFFFMPRRRVEVEFVEVRQLPMAARPDSGGEVNKKPLNAWLENFYNEKPQPALGVPRYFWQGSRPYELPETACADRQDGQATQLAAISPAARHEVYAVLREAARLEPEYPITDNLLLNADLHLDSLSMMEVVAGLEERLNVGLSDPERLIAVHDVLLAVSDQLRSLTAGAGENCQPPAGWFTPAQAGKIDLDVLGGNIPEAFLNLARRRPGAIVSGERSGAKAVVRTRHELLTAAMTLAGRIQAMPGRRIGLMLPAAPAALAVWLAAMLAGKETVFLNWTVGQANLKHCMELAGVSQVLTSAALLDRLERQGLSFSGLPAEWHSLERLAASLRLGEKLRGLARARFTRSLAGCQVMEIAAILFTSGSETLPKAVPLTHRNLLTNASDAVRVLGLATDDKIVAMLPPFHSFGLLADLVLPLAFGLQAAFHPNPTEASRLAELIRDFKLTLLPATPTFLDAILERARKTDHLASLRYTFAGAEKCPEHVYRAFAATCPQAALCEGYGITECSPVVSVNRPGDVAEGSIGQALPSVRTALVREENGTILGDTPTGETGMLLVRGPSIFGGYLGDAPSPFVRYQGVNWYRTGDLASMDAEGRITFRGRLKRFVKIGGEMISLPQIESLLLAAFGNRPDAPAEGPALAVEAGPEENGAEVVLFTPMALKLTEVNAALRQAGLSALYSVKKLAGIKEIPLLGTGKTDYRRLKELLFREAERS